MRRLLESGSVERDASRGSQLVDYSLAIGACSPVMRLPDLSVNEWTPSNGLWGHKSDHKHCFKVLVYNINRFTVSEKVMLPSLP